MRSSGNKNGYTPVDHVVFDLILPLLSTSAQSIFLRIYRQTFGWNKQTDKIALSQFKQWCGIKRHETIEKALEDLKAVEYMGKEFRLITMKGKGTSIKEFGINWGGVDSLRQRYLLALEDEERKLSTSYPQ